VHGLELVALDELGEAPSTAVAVKADGAVGAMCVGAAAVELDELEGETGAEGWQVQHLHEEGDIRGGPAVRSRLGTSGCATSNIINIILILKILLLM
jgi:hypothetical protein